MACVIWQPQVCAERLSEEGSCCVWHREDAHNASFYYSFVGAQKLTSIRPCIRLPHSLTLLLLAEVSSPEPICSVSSARLSLSSSVSKSEIAILKIFFYFFFSHGYFCDLTPHWAVSGSAVQTTSPQKPSSHLHVIHAYQVKSSPWVSRQPCWGSHLVLSSTGSQ